MGLEWIVLDGKFVVGCGPGKFYPEISMFQYMLERTDVITNKVLKIIMFVLAYPTLSITAVSIQ